MITRLCLACMLACSLSASPLRAADPEIITLPDGETVEMYTYTFDPDKVINQVVIRLRLTPLSVVDIGDIALAERYEALNAQIIESYTTPDGSFDAVEAQAFLDDLARLDWFFGYERTNLVRALNNLGERIEATMIILNLVSGNAGPAIAAMDSVRREPG